MFVTHKTDLNLISGLGGNDYLVWPAVQISLFTPWLLVIRAVREQVDLSGSPESVAEDDDGVSMRQTMLLSTVDQLVTLIQLDKKGESLLEAVWVITPAGTAESLQWRMERATAILETWVAHPGSGAEVRVPILEVESGEQMPFSSWAFDLDFPDEPRFVSHLPKGESMKPPSTRYSKETCTF